MPGTLSQLLERLHLRSLPTPSDSIRTADSVEDEELKLLAVELQLNASRSLLSLGHRDAEFLHLALQGLPVQPERKCRVRDVALRPSERALDGVSLRTSEQDRESLDHFNLRL
jgi:hypothetical protein